MQQQNVVQTNPLPDLNAIPPMGLADEACLNEIADVLKKHNRLQRFGVTLLHQHFPIGDDEVMLETNDPASRTLEMRTCKRDELEGQEVTITSWRLDTGKPQMACVCVKMGSDHQHHSRG